MSNAANDSISLDDLIAAVGGPSGEGGSSPSPSSSSSAKKSAASEPAPSIDLLSALGLDSLPADGERPDAFLTERERRERKREAQRREQQIRSQQWQRELREIEAKKARIEAEKPISSPEVDRSVVQTVPSGAAAEEQASSVRRRTVIPTFEGELHTEQPLADPAFLDSSKEPEPQGMSAQAPATSLAETPTPQAEQEPVSTKGRGRLRQASFSSLPRTHAAITPLAGVSEVRSSSSDAQQQEMLASQITYPSSEASAHAQENASFAPPSQASPLSEEPASKPLPKRMSFSDYRAGQVSIKPLTDDNADDEAKSVIEASHIQLAEEKSTTALTHLITQDHSQTFSEPSEAMNLPASYPEPFSEEGGYGDAAELHGEDAYELDGEDAEGFEEAGEGHAFSSAFDEGYDVDDLDEVFAEEDTEEEPTGEPSSGDEEESSSPQITKRSLPLSGTSSFSAIEPELTMPDEERYGQPSGVLPPLSGSVIEQIPFDVPEEEQTEEDLFELDEPQVVSAPIYEAPASAPPMREGAEQVRKPTLRQVEPAFAEEKAKRGTKSRIVGITLIVVAVLCGIFAIVLVSGLLDFEGTGAPEGDNGSNDAPPAAVYEVTGADTATYSYVVRGPDGSTHEAVEEAVFDEDGILIESTITVNVDNQETADTLLEQLREEFGDSVMDYKASDSKVIVVLDIERNDLTKDIYTELLSANMAEFKVLG